MEKEKKVIGVIDADNNNIYVLNTLYNTFKNCEILYYNTNTVEKYEGLDEETFVSDVKNSIDFLINNKVDILVVASDTIIEYCMPVIEEIKIPYILITEETINYINEKYEYKNLGFLACTSVIEANMYQKNFRYNHLYNMTSDSLTETLKNYKVKTSESFQETKMVVGPVSKKGLDIIIPSSINYLMLKTEIFEFLKEVDLLPIDEVIAEKVNTMLYNNLPPIKGKTNVTIIETIDKDKKEFDKYLQCDYRVVNILNPKSKLFK